MRPRLKTRVLPFALPLLGAAVAGSSLRLPTDWSLAAPTGQVAATGTLPESARVTADGAHLIVLEGGQAGAAIGFYDPQTLAPQSRLKLDGAFGDVVADASGDGFWAATAGSNSLIHVAAGSATIDRTLALPQFFWASAVAVSPDRKTLAASGDQLQEVALLDAASGLSLGTVKTGPHPAGLVFSPDGATLYVADWGASTLSVLDVAKRTLRASIPVGRHPEVLQLSRDGTTLYVSETDDDTIGVVDLQRGVRTGGINVGLYREALIGASPTALALSADGSRLFVACSAANAIAVVHLGGAGGGQALGAIPAGWYPTALELARDGKSLYVANGMGEGSRANPQFDPFGHSSAHGGGYVAASMLGSVRRIAIPNDDGLIAGLQTVRALGGPFLRAAIDDPDVRQRGPASDDAGRSVVRLGGPLKHVIYVIKENRTYDQVLGDLPGADGDAALAYFGARVTPNQHALAQRFGIFDNTFANAEVSADGHNWSMGAYANDYLEKTWPPNYGGRRRGYDFEDGATASVGHSGFLWNAAARAGVSLRDYGEFVTNGARTGDDATTQMPDLNGRIDPKYPGFDTSLRDEDREAEWAREFAGYVRRDDLPALEIVRLPNDHTAGTTPGQRTPQAMVAENDLALGRLVDAVSHSPYWRDTAIFAIEDDAQNGPDHVDDQRTTLYLASAYARGGLQHAHYTSAGLVRTIELILGLAPLSAFDASARPLYAAFAPTPDLRPYDALPAKLDLDARNTATSYRARDSARMDFSRADAAPAAALNDILAHSADSPPAGAR
jgi:YVTN family beta-propeller protein